MIVRIVPIVPVVSKDFEMIGMTETIADFHKAGSHIIAAIVSIAAVNSKSGLRLGRLYENQFWIDSGDLFELIAAIAIRAIGRRPGRSKR